MAARQTPKAEKRDGGKRRLILHVGVQKTGSTAIQRHLMGNAGLLADRLIVLTPEEGTPMRPLGRAAVAYSLSPSAGTEAALRIAFQHVLDGLPGNDLPILLSHENLAGAMPGNGGETGLYPTLPQIALLLSDAAAGFDVELVFYSRKMDDWKPSVWAQAIHTDGYMRRLTEFQTETEAMPGWGNLLQRLTGAIGADRVTRFRLEDEEDTTRPGWQLLRHAGLADAEIAALAPLDGLSMPRLNGGATEFLRRLNGLSLSPHARGKVADLVARTQYLFTADAPSEGTL